MNRTASAVMAQGAVKAEANKTEIGKAENRNPIQNFTRNNGTKSLSRNHSFQPRMNTDKHGSKPEEKADLVRVGPGAYG